MRTLREETREVGRRNRREEHRSEWREEKKRAELLLLFKPCARTEEELSSLALPDLWLRRAAFSLHTKERKKRYHTVWLEVCGINTSSASANLLLLH